MDPTPAAPPPAQPAAGRVVGGRYALLAPLGSGGMGTVWRAEDRVLGRQVAVKEVVRPHGLSEAEWDVVRERTRREARAAARLDHASAVTVYDVVEEGDQPWLVLELVEARTLAQVVREDGPLTARRTAQVGLAVLGALRAAHAQGIVHRDVKPSNVLLGPSRVVLTDFGIATSAGDASLTSTGLLLGSPSYMAPERARGLAPGPASDLWSLGATLFTAVEGRPPFDKGEPVPTLTAVVSGDREPYVAAGPLVPVLDGLLATDPDRRMGAARAQAELERVAALPDEVSSPPPRPAPEPQGRRSLQTSAFEVAPGRAPRRRTRRSRGPAIVGAAVVVVGAVAAALLLRGAPSGPAAGAPAAVGPSASSPAGATAPPAPAAPATLPAGWTRYTDPVGWSVGVPPGYQRGTFRGQVQFKDPATRRTLRVDYRATPRGTALSAWQAASPAFARSLRSYDQLALRQVAYRGWDAADLEFTYVDGVALHTLDRDFVTGGHAYALYWQTLTDDWGAARPVLDQVLASFVPA